MTVASNTTTDFTVPLTAGHVYLISAKGAGAIGYFDNSHVASNIAGGFECDNERKVDKLSPASSLTMRVIRTGTMEVQIENVTDTPQATSGIPSEYVSVPTVHNRGIGKKAFTTELANTIDSNVVTDVVGTTDLADNTFAPTFSRDSTAHVRQGDGTLVEVPIGCARLQGLRTVNLADSTGYGLGVDGWRAYTTDASGNPLVRTHKTRNLSAGTNIATSETIDTLPAGHYVFSAEGTYTGSISGAGVYIPISGTGAADRDVFSVYLSEATGLLIECDSNTIEKPRLDSRVGFAGDSVHWPDHYDDPDGFITYSSWPYAVDTVANEGTYQVPVPCGYLVEPSRTNEFLQSCAHNTTPNLTWQGVVTENDATAPNGATEASKLAIDTGDTTASFYQQCADTGKTWTHSVFLKAGTVTSARVGIELLGEGRGVTADLSAGTVGAVADIGTGAGASGGTASIEAFADGWYRVTLAGVASTAANNCSIAIDGAAGDYVYAWGSQCEEGNFPTSFIKTTTADLTRSPDDLKYAHQHDDYSGMVVFKGQPLYDLTALNANRGLVHFGDWTTKPLMHGFDGIKCDDGTGSVEVGDISEQEPLVAALRWGGGKMEVGVLNSTEYPSWSWSGGTDAYDGEWPQQGNEVHVLSATSDDALPPFIVHGVALYDTDQSTDYIEEEHG